MIRAAWIFLAIVAAPGLAPGQDSAAVSIAVTTPRTEYFAGEPFEVTLRVSVATSMLPSLLQTSSQELDVPVLVSAPWMRDLAGAIALGEPATRALKTATIAVDGRRETGARIEEGSGERARTVVAIARRFVATAPGPLVIPAPTLRYAYATRFDEDLVNGRVPADRRNETATGAGRTLTIVPLPEAGRPAAFSGAVGKFTVRALAAPRALDAGQSLRLTLAIEGDGNLPAFDPPRIDGLAGFRVQGLLDDRGGTTRRITYDLVPVSATVTEVPAIAFSFFDPAPPPQYRTVRTEAIPIIVRAGPSSRPAPSPRAPAEPAMTPGRNDIHGLKDAGAVLPARAYAAGRWAEARALFEPLLDDGAAAKGEVLYDLGNCDFRMGRYADAILAYRRAQRILPRDGEVRFNLRLAEKQLGLVEKAPASFGDAVAGALDRFTDGELVALAAAIFAAAVAVLIMRRKSFEWRIATACAMLAALAIAARPARSAFFPGPRAAVVLADDLAVRDEPHAESASKLRLRAGESVRVSGCSDRWARVVLDHGSGWVERSAIGLVDPPTS